MLNSHPLIGVEFALYIYRRSKFGFLRIEEISCCGQSRETQFKGYLAAVYLVLRCLWPCNPCRGIVFKLGLLSFDDGP